MRSNKLCVIAHRYIPYSGVNGVRWINLSRELADLGWDVTVFTVKRPASAVLDPTQSGRVTVEYVESDFFYRLVEWTPSGIFKKIVKVMCLKFGSLIWKDDYADYWYSPLEIHLKKYIEKQPDAIMVATGAPFQACFHGAKIAKKLGVKFVADFQDPWFFDPLSSSSHVIEKRRVEKHRFIVENSACRFYVTDGLRAHYGDTELGGTVVENAQCLVAPVNHEKRYISELRLLYFGTLANGRDRAFLEWLDCLKGVTESYGEISIDVYGRVSEYLLRALTARGALVGIKINLLGSIDQSMLPKIAHSYLGAIQINAKAYPFLVSTKIYEYPAVRLPTLSINFGGQIENLVVENSIGVSHNLERNVDFNLGLTIHQLKNIKQEDLEIFSSKNSWKARAMQIDSLLKSL